MSSVLIDALLSSSPDYDRLFESLSWPSESCPGPERVEALTAVISGLGPLLEDSDASRFTVEKRRHIQGKIESVIWTQCLPLLGSEYPHKKPVKPRGAAGRARPLPAGS